MPLFLRRKRPGGLVWARNLHRGVATGSVLEDGQSSKRRECIAEGATLVPPPSSRGHLRAGAQTGGSLLSWGLWFEEMWPKSPKDTVGSGPSSTAELSDDN